MTPRINGRCEIGQNYLVPCLRASSTPPNFARKGEWIPVLLPMHDDAEIIGLPARHWHLDFRFLTDRQYKEAGMGSILHDQITGASESRPRPPLYEAGIVYRRMKCLREMPVCYPSHLARWYPKLEAAYANARLINFRCPHKGIDLSGCPAQNGVISCPGHGLMWNVETGEMVTEAEAFSRVSKGAGGSPS